MQVLAINLSITHCVKPNQQVSIFGEKKTKKHMLGRVNEQVDPPTQSYCSLTFLIVIYPFRPIYPLSFSKPVNSCFVTFFDK